MSGTQPSAPRFLPRPVQIKDGTSVVLRLMTPGDAASIAAFARSLPEDDLLFLRMDITDPDAVAHWMRNLEAGLTTTVIAEAGGSIAGYAALVQNRVAWQRHLGEIRAQVALRYRSQGLGRTLAGEIFALARERGPPQDRGPDDAGPEGGDGHLRAARLPAGGAAAGLRGRPRGAHP
ncbi:MAG: GNAT family N-acetyltransferase [Candidatus Rokuibacteriota bacterium]